MEHPRKTEHVFVTGGVVSSLGKGLTASSLGSLLVARGLSVTMQKLDPYLNVDPGTMNPFQHGEVFVTDDGAEADLDIGHYERFLDVNLTRDANVTTGKVYSSVIAKERRGEYLGDTVQVIPHITGEIRDSMMAMGGPDIDVVIHEIGGTVGDIESLPFLEAARQVRHEIGRENVFFLHVSLVPFIKPSGEMKTKPTQHSVAALRQVGIQPDAIVCRSESEVSQALKRKIALMCDVEEEAVVSCADAPSFYAIPKVLHAEGLDAYVVRRMNLSFHDVDWTVWNDLLQRVEYPRHQVTVALVGKYVDLPDAYLSVCEALRAGGFANWARVNVRWVRSDDCDTPEGAARNLAGVADAASSEFDPDTEHPVIATMAEQTDIVAGGGDMGGSMRFGSYPADLAPGTLAHTLYGTSTVAERHRHRYEVNNAYREQLEAAGLVVSGTSPSGTLVEFVELPLDVHPYYIATQAHPELKSRPTKAHPLFSGLITAALERQEEQTQ